MLDPYLNSKGTINTGKPKPAAVAPACTPPNNNKLLKPPKVTRL